MAGPIAFCENPKCGAVFQFDKFIGGAGSATFQFKNCRVSPCPSCGGSGLIPDGTYEYANEVLKLLSGPGINVNELRKIEKILRSARRTKETNEEEILSKVKETSPDIAQAIERVPRQHNILNWILILIALISLAIQTHSTYFKDDTKSTEKKVIEYLLREFGSEIRTKKNLGNEGTYRRSGPKIRRNDPCPCGSGKKYKKCCDYQLTSV